MKIKNLTDITRVDNFQDGDYLEYTHDNGMIEKKYYFQPYVQTAEEILEEKTAEEKDWRDSELNKTDKLATIKDHPYFYAHISYREELRNYPTSIDFPNGVRPILDTTIKNALTKFQFMSRFTVEERKAVTALAKTNQDLEDWLDLFKLTEEMNLNDPQTIAGVQMLEAGGIIGVGRANEILA